jgi:hypothetical protein
LVSYREAWAAEVADAPHFFAEAGLPQQWLNEYATAMRALTDQAAQVIRCAFRDAATAVYEPRLPAKLPADPRPPDWPVQPPEPAAQPALLEWTKVVTKATSEIWWWMHELADQGVSGEEREVTLHALERTYSEPVARVRRMIDEQHRA